MHIAFCIAGSSSNCDLAVYRCMQPNTWPAYKSQGMVRQASVIGLISPARVTMGFHAPWAVPRSTWPAALVGQADLAGQASGVPGALPLLAELPEQLGAVLWCLQVVQGPRAASAQAVMLMSLVVRRMQCQALLPAGRWPGCALAARTVWVPSGPALQQGSAEPVHAAHTEAQIQPVGAVSPSSMLTHGLYPLLQLLHWGVLCRRMDAVNMRNPWHVSASGWA